MTDRTCKKIKNGLKASLADCGVCQRRLKEHTKNTVRYENRLYLEKR